MFIGALSGANYPPGPLTAAGSSCLFVAAVPAAAHRSFRTEFLVTTDYKSSVFLPKTDFPMRGGLPKKEPELLKRWADMKLWDRLRAESKGRPKFVLHDGPPYANGNLHIGHALNKILKDLVSRTQQMLGKDSHYVPGWDCHGLPIEWKIEEQYRAKKQDKDQVPVVRVPHANAAPSPITGSACSARSSSGWASTATGTTTTRR